MISVILPVFNRAETISACISQLLECPDVCQVLVADGGSVDGTIDIIRALDDPRVSIVSQQDNGIYQGANKAFAKASENLLWFMNSDDLASPEYAVEAVRIFKKDVGIDFVFGDIIYGSRLVRPRLLNQKHAVWQSMPLPHVSLIIRRSIHERYLMAYDESRAIGGDLDYLNRLLKCDVKGHYIELAAAKCAPGGISTSRQQIWEARRIAIHHGKSRVRATAFALAAICRRSWSS